MLRGLFDKLKQGAKSVWSVVKTPLRRIGEFAIKHHQPIAMLGSALASQSDNPTIKTLGAGLALGSAYLTQKGVGNNYLSPSQTATA